MNERFPRNKLVPNNPGTLVMRFGQPRRIARPEFENFEPFDPGEVARLREVLEDETDTLMDAINELLEPAYRWGEDRRGDGLEGVSRFFD